MTGSTSTNTLGFMLWTLALTATLWLASVAADWWKSRKETGAFRNAFAGSLTSGIFSAIGVSLLVLLVWAGFIVRIVFNDHEYFVAKTKELPQINQELAAAKAKLLTTPYRGDRHITSEQENALYLALRDVAVSTPENRRVIYLGFIDGDQESRRFVQLFLWNNFTKAGWKVNEFRRNVKHKDSDLQMLGGADVSVTSTLFYTEVQKSPGWKEQEQQMEGLLTAIRVLEQANISTNQGLLMDKNDPLMNKRGFIVWVNPKQDGAK